MARPDGLFEGFSPRGRLYRDQVSFEASPQTVELVRSGYPSTKAEMEKAWSVPDRLTFDQITRAIFQPVKLRWGDEPRNRR